MVVVVVVVVLLLLLLRTSEGPNGRCRHRPVPFSPRVPRPSVPPSDWHGRGRDNHQKEDENDE